MGRDRYESKKLDVLLLFQLSFVVIGLLMIIYIKGTESYNLLPLMLIILSITLIIMGLREYERNKRTYSLLLFILTLFISLFILYSTIMGLYLRSNSSLPTAPPWYVILQLYSLFSINN